MPMICPIPTSIRAVNFCFIRLNPRPKKALWYVTLTISTRIPSPYPIQIRKNHLDRSIRDGDLLSITGLCVNPNIQFGSHADFQDPLNSTEKNEAHYPPEWTKESQNIETASESIASIPPADEVLHASLQKKKRNRSISSKFWLLNKLAATGVISYA